MVAAGVILMSAVFPYRNSAFSVPFVMKNNEFLSEKFLCKGTAVDAELVMIMDSFASENVSGVVRQKILGADKYEYNIVPVFVGDETYYVGIKLTRNLFLQAENVIKATSSYHYGEEVIFDDSFEVEGTLLSMDEELYGYMSGWFAEMDWLSEEEIGKYVLSVVIEPVEPEMVRIGAYLAIGLIMVGAVCIIVTFFIDVKYVRRARVLRKCHGVIESERRGKPISIPVKELDDVDMAMWKGQKEKARKILIKSYKATEQEADDIINRWVELTSPEEM